MPTRSAMVAGRSRRLTVSCTTSGDWPRAGQADQQRHMDFGAIKIFAVLKETMLPKFLAVVRGDDHQGLFEHARGRSNVSNNSPS